MRISVSASPISQGNVSGVALVFFALAIGGATFFILYIAGVTPEADPELLKSIQWWRDHPEKAHVERWVLAVVAAVFGLAGLSIGIAGIIEASQKKKMLEAKKRNPHSPWLWDYNWKFGRNLNRASTPWWNHLIGISILFGFHAVAWAIAIKEKFKGMILIFPIGITLFTVLVALIFWMILKRAKAHKNVTLTLNDFPIRLGSNFKVYIGGLKPMLVKKLHISLEAIEEVYNYDEHGSGVKTKRVFEVEQDIQVSSDKVELDFLIPSDAQASQLSLRPAKFWELHIYGQCEGPDLDKRFLLPIY